ncbi:MAG: ion transporter [Rhodobacteraceae bacterium]|nr:ion transporter [Paracoccaceae bacterium]MYF46503.1 ion transporter [Paracoccaceae bacterium]MYI91151.1 ion transporter [Paracoccaceae bacterium]
MISLTELVQRHDTKAGRVFEWSIIVLIVVSVLLLIVDSIPDLPQSMRLYLRNTEYIFLGIFALEYILRVLTAPRKSGYIFSFFGIVDLLAFVPFILTMGTIDMRILRVVRLLRIFRIMKLSSYDNALVRFGDALMGMKEEFVIFLFASSLVLLISAAGIWHFEHEVQPEEFSSIISCLWWAIITLATVGYGDLYPITPGGKIFTSIIVMSGMGILAVPAGMVTSALFEVTKKSKHRKRLPHKGRPMLKEAAS